jgi:O-antigen/teichoic acid export membrane protein
MEEAKKFSSYTIAQMLINIFFCLLFVVGFRFGYMGLIYATFIDSFVIFCILFWKFQKMFPMRLNAKMLWDNLKYGIPLLPENFTGGINDFFDKFMLRSAISLSSTGIYSIAQNVATKLFVFMTAVQSTFYPIYMKDIFDRGKEAAQSIGRNFTIFTYISLFFVLVMILFGEEVIHILAPASYYNSIDVVLILLCSVATQVFGKITGIPLTYVKRAYFSLPISVVGVAANVGLNLLLIPHLGAMGAGVAMLISVSVINIIGVSVAQRYYRILYEKKILFLIFANLFLSASLLIYLRFIEMNLFVKYFVKLFSLLSFFWIGIKANIITKRNIGIIANMLKPKKISAKYSEL